MDKYLINLTTALLASLVLAAEAMSHFPAKFSSDLVERNSLSPLSGKGGTNSETMRDWVKVNHKLGRITRVTSGDRFEMECESFGSPAPRIEWFKGGVPLALKGMEEENEIMGFGWASVVSRFVADCATPIHEGTYTCGAVAGGVSQKTAPTTVIVEGETPQLLLEECLSSTKSPRIIMFSSYVLQTMGSDVKIPCRAQGSPSPRTYWIFNDTPLQQNQRMKVLKTGDLYINTLRWSDMGRYVCVAENPIGKDSATTFLYPLMNEE